MIEKVNSLQQLMDGVLSEFDSRNLDHDRQVSTVADEILGECDTANQISEFEQKLAPGSPIAAHLAVKLAGSKSFVQSIKQPLHVSVVFAVYSEHTRILTPDQHPHGEDFVVRKISQLEWLLADNPAVTWSLWIVDDGCPHGSGKIARQVLDERFPDAPVHVLFLEDAIRDGAPVTIPMKSAAESQKGGSVLYGMQQAAEQPEKSHVIVFTDADLSTHLGQVGLLLNGIAAEGNDAAIGSRREPTSVVIKQGHRNTRGKLFIYLWKSLIQPLGYITDTQCGFKAFTAETVREIVTDMIEKRFAFDIELLLKTELRGANSICKVPIAWIDSEAASTTTGLQPYLPMLKSVAAMYWKYLPSNPESDAFAQFIASMTEQQWQHLSENVPAEIAGADPATFDQYRPVDLHQLRQVAAASK